MIGWQQPIISWNTKPNNARNMFVEAITPETNEKRKTLEIMTPLFKNKEGT